jgi:hypothetical protein
MTPQLTLESVREIALTEVKSYLPEPKAKPRDPGTADDVKEYCSLLFKKTGRHATNAQIQDWMKRHPEEMERDYPGYKKRCAALRRKALEPEYIAAKATMKAALSAVEGR